LFVAIVLILAGEILRCKGDLGASEVETRAQLARQALPDLTFLRARRQVPSSVKCRSVATNVGADDLWRPGGSAELLVESSTLCRLLTPRPAGDINARRSLEIKAGTVFTTEGEMGSEFFQVRAGTARCVRNGRLVATFGPGDFFGETTLLINTRRTATVTAVDNMTVIVFSRREFSSLLDQSPQIARKLLKALAEREASGEARDDPLA